MRENGSHPTGSTISESVFAMEERLHWRDHHCMDAGVEYDLKHADLEKSFGVNIPVSGVKFWSRIIPGSLRHKFKRKANGRDICTAGITAKRRILDCSASAARGYFQGLVSESIDMRGELNTIYRTSVKDSAAQKMTSENQNGALDIETGKLAENGKFEAGDGSLSGVGISEPENSMMNEISLPEKSGIEPLPKSNHFSDHINGFSFILDPFLLTLGKISGGRNFSVENSSIGGVATAGKTDSCHESTEDLVVNVVNRDADSKGGSHTPGEQMFGSTNDASENQGGHSSVGSIFIKLYHLCSMHQSVNIWSLSLNLGLSSLLKNVGELWSRLLAGPVQRLKSEVGPKVEDIVAELVEGVDDGETLAIEKMLPVTLDCVHFKGGTLMLLAYGDSEPR